MFESAPPSAGEVRALANQLLSWANLLSARPTLGPNPSEEEKLELVLGMATAARESGLLRERLMPGIELGNPAWQVLLEVFIRQENGFRIEPERLPALLGLPSDILEATTTRLVASGLVEIRSEGTKQRLALSYDGRKKMIDLLMQSSEFVWPQPAAPVEAVATNTKVASL